MSAIGRSLITWYQYDGSNNSVYFSDYPTNGPWDDPVDVTDDISPPGRNAFVTEVAMDDYGNAIVDWLQNDAVDDQIFMNEYR